MKRILCFGDSNTWGYIPGTGERYDEDTRWTGILQKELGPDYRILEDGMNGRTTAVELPWSPYRNGQDSLPYSLLARKPLDLLIISLGINDLVSVAPEYSAKCALGLYRRASMVQAIPGDPGGPVFPDGVKVLFVIPAPVHPDYDKVFAGIMEPLYERSLRLKECYTLMAQTNGLPCIYAGDYAEASPVDCIHYTPESHAALGKALAEKVKELLA